MYNILEIKPIIQNAIATSKSMREAAFKTNMNFKTFVKYAKLLNIYNPNQPGKGINKPNSNKIPLSDILLGLHPNYHTFKLGKRLIKENIKQHICENCQNTHWLNNPIPLELHHIDGDPYNHKLNNLQLLCPNCHTLTSNYRGKNKK